MVNYMFKRFYGDIGRYLQSGKVLVIYGARRVGKTTVLNDFLENYEGKYLKFNGDDLRVREVLSSSNIDKIKSFCGNCQLLAIDEAQMIPEIGHGLKIVVDHVPDIKVIATGSSSFDLANKIGEPLVGRKKTISMYPLSQIELREEYNEYQLQQNLEQYLVFGSYPELLTLKNNDEKIEYLNELAGAYLYRDILAFNFVRNPAILNNLVKILAFQVGNEVSLNNLSNRLGTDVKTIARYIDLLEKTFVIFSLGGFSRNLNNEINNKKKYYFYDLGIRNAVIRNYNSLENRDDIGALWENFIISERLKRNEYKRYFCNKYFWRTYDKKEIDYIEEYNGQLPAYEIKWNPKAKVKNPDLFLNSYKNSSFNLINSENYLDFLLE